MAQLAQPVEPFGEVNVYRRADGQLEIVATILMEPDIEGAKAGLALDASASMKKAYGASAPVSSLFAKAAGVTNSVEPVARTMAAYLARFASDSRVHLVYWACGPDGSVVEPIGTVTELEAAKLNIRGPRSASWGRGTKLLPPVRHFAENAFRDARWAIAVFVTDGVIEDLQAVKDFCTRFAQLIADGKRSSMKFVLLGIGEEVDEGQMEELDDMFEGNELRDRNKNPIDLWDHKLVSEMRSLSEIFAEVVSENLIVAGSGRVLDSTGKVVRSYEDGLPALLRFRLSASSQSFVVEMPGVSITQDISEALLRL